MIKKNIFAEKPINEESCHGGNGSVLFRRILEKDFQSKISFLDYTIIPPGASIGYHRHLDTEEVYVIIAGTGLMTVDGESQPVSRGDVVLNKMGGSHGLVNNSAATLEILVFEGKF